MQFYRMDYKFALYDALQQERALSAERQATILCCYEQ